MNLKTLYQAIETLSKSAQEDNLLPVLKIKVAKAASAYPQDKTIGAVYTILNKLSSDSISKDELKSLYQKTYTVNTKFAQLFKDEMGLEESKSPVTFAPTESTLIEGPKTDEILVNALSHILDHNTKLVPYSQKLGKQATNDLFMTLSSWGATPKDLSIESGNDKFIVIKASYETPKGIIALYVPVSVKEAKASVFIGSTGTHDLTKSNLKEYVVKHATNKFNLDSKAVVNALTKAASEDREVSDTEIAMIRLNASRGQKQEYFTNSILGVKFEDSKEDVKAPKYAEFSSFENQFSKPYGVASFTFGQDKVENLRESVASYVKGLGYTNPQIAIEKSEENKVVLAISLNGGKIAFSVPVKFSKGKFEAPSLLVCNGSVGSFDIDGIKKLQVNNEVNYKTAAVSSTMFGATASELIKNVKEAMANQNLEVAEDALNVLANYGDEKAYATAFAAYKNGLTPKKAEKECKCSMIIKSPSSKHDICGHTGLPLHKVYQDKFGSCSPLYRKNMSETYEGAVFMDHKMFG